MRVILSQITQMTQRNAAGLHLFADVILVRLVWLLHFVCVDLQENNPNNVYIPLALLAIYTPERMRALPRYAIVVIGSFRNNALTMTVVIGLR